MRDKAFNILFGEDAFIVVEDNHEADHCCFGMFPSEKFAEAWKDIIQELVTDSKIRVMRASDLYIRED